MSVPAVLAPLPQWRVFTATGVVASGAKLYTYLSGTTTPAATYTDGTSGIPRTNPVVADSGGLLPPIFVPVGVAYRFTLTDANGVVLWGPVDNIGATAFSTTLNIDAAHFFGGTSQASRNEAAYPAGATLDKLAVNTDVVAFDAATLITGAVYTLQAVLATDGGGTVSLGVMNLTDADTTALVTLTSTSTTGQQVTSGPITFAAAGASKTYGVKLKVTAGNGWAWGVRIVRSS